MIFYRIRSYLITAAYKVAANANLDEMVADCMKDVNSDEEPSEVDDDPTLLVHDIMSDIIYKYSEIFKH